MIDFIKNFIYKKDNTPPLYYYCTKITVTDRYGRPATTIKFDKKLTQNEKVALRRKLKKANPECKVTIRGGYVEYVR